MAEIIKFPEDRDAPALKSERPQKPTQHGFERASTKSSIQLKGEMKHIESSFDQLGSLSLREGYEVRIETIEFLRKAVLKRLRKEPLTADAEYLYTPGLYTDAELRRELLKVTRELKKRKQELSDYDNRHR